MHKSVMMPALVGVLLAVSACEDSTPQDPVLAEGKVIWESTCRVCHLGGIAGAPKIGDRSAWEGRIEQGLDTLTSHAMHGFQGTEGEMPARGGNVSLSDEQVAAAVRYMVSQSQ